VTRARLGALALLALPLAFQVAAGAQEGGGREALVVRMPGASFEELFAIREVAGIARAGGLGLLANAGDVVTVAGADERVVELDPALLGGLREAGTALRREVTGVASGELLVIVLGGTLPETVARKDELVGIAMASGPPSALFPSAGDPGSLTSASTRRAGVVTGGDVRATLNLFLGEVPYVAGELPAGEPIEVIEGPPPFELHDRYLAHRRMSVPIGTAAAAYAGVTGLLAVAGLAFPARVPASLRRAAGWACLSIPALATGLLAAGHLPELTYATVVPFVALVTAFGTMAFAPLASRSPVLVPVGIGVSVVAYFVLEAALAWSAALTPLLGGSQLDGARFYGLPNAFVGLLIGASLYVAQALPTRRGTALVFGVALLAGLPFLGANLGGGVSLCAAAGLWFGLRERARLGPRRAVAAFVAVTAIGSAAIWLAHALSPLRTHVTRFEEAAGGLGGLWSTFVDRLRVGLELIERNPAALVPVLGLPVVLLLVLRPPDPLGATLRRWPAWRDALLVTVLAGGVAYLANDSGPAAAGLAFGLGLGGLLGVPLLPGAGKMEVS
jgi:hypothetical protein